jgi:hypothetical protein
VRVRFPAGVDGRASGPYRRVMTTYETARRACDIEISADLGFAPGRLEMTFSTERPLEVVFLFDSLDGIGGVAWTFGRELMHSALNEDNFPFGDGDVSLMGDPAGVAIVLESPEGTAMIKCPRYDVELFATECLLLAPVGGSLIEQRVAAAIEQLIEELTA